MFLTGKDGFLRIYKPSLILVRLSINLRLFFCETARKKKALLSESKPLIIQDREQVVNEFQVVTIYFYVLRYN